MKEKIRAILKSKTNWVSIVTLVAAVVGIVISFLDLDDDKLSRKIISIVLTLLAFELFTLLVGRLDSISGALQRMESRDPKGAQLITWDTGTINKMITEAKKELFFCGAALSRLTSYRAELVAIPKTVRIRLLVMDIDDEAVSSAYRATYGRPPELDSLSHLNWFSTEQNFEIRTVNFPITMYFSAKDMSTVNGAMCISFLEFGNLRGGYPSIDLTPVDKEWYKRYKNQIELLWEQGTPWEP